MREVLFRGKRIDNDEWIKGSFWNEIPGELGGIATYGSCVFRHVHLTTVGQFTGLTDKNGEKIFEGDIVKSVFNKESYVVLCGEYVYETDYTGEMHGFYLENIRKKYDVSPFGCSYNWAVIIGNIHDNPELITGGECDAVD